MTFHKPRRLLFAAALAFVAIPMASCAGGFQRSDVAASFSESYPDATAGQSECVTDRLVDRYGIDELEKELSRPEMSSEFEESQFRDMFACGMDGDVRTQLEVQLIDSGVDQDNAPCVADELAEGMSDDDIGVLLSGEITEKFYEKFFQAMDGCDAING